MKLNDSKINEINAYILNAVGDELRNYYPKANYFLKEFENRTNPSFCVQWWYNEDFNRIFLWYELDYWTRYNLDPSEVYTRINTRLKNNFYRDLCLHLELLDPMIRVYDGERVTHVVDSSCKYIRLGCFSYWECDGVLRFLESQLVTSYNLLNTGEYRKETANILKAFADEVDILNHKYNFEFNNDEDVKAGFEEYKVLYKKHFGVDLEAVKEEDVHRFYIDIDFGLEEDE